MGEVPKGFHARNGWYFRRENDGAVHITAPDSMGPGAHQVVTLDAETWASVVASVSPDGDTVATYIAAHHIHDGSKPAVAMPEVEQVAQAAYAAYGETTDHKNFRGEPMPAWEDLGDTIRGAWVAAAGTVVDRVTESKETPT